MKSAWLPRAVLVVMLANGVWLRPAEAQQQTAAEDALLRIYHESAGLTVRLYPDAQKPGTEFNRRIRLMDEQLQADGDPLFYSFHKPLVIAQWVAAELGVAPKGGATSPDKESAEERYARIYRESRAKVSALYPDALEPGTEFSRRYKEEERKLTDPKFPLRDDPRVPIFAAERVAVAMGIPAAKTQDKDVAEARDLAEDGAEAGRIFRERMAEEQAAKGRAQSPVAPLAGNTVTVRLPHGVSLAMPQSMSVETPDGKVQSGASMGGTLDLAGVQLSHGQQRRVTISASGKPEDPRLTIASLNRVAGALQEKLLAMTKDEVAQFGSTESEVQEVAGRKQHRVERFERARKVKIGDLWVLQSMRFVTIDTKGIHPPTVSKYYLILANGIEYDGDVHFPEAQAKQWEPIFDGIIASLKFDGSRAVAGAGNAAGPGSAGAARGATGVVRPSVAEPMAQNPIQGGVTIRLQRDFTVSVPKSWTIVGPDGQEHRAADVKDTLDLRSPGKDEQLQPINIVAPEDAIVIEIHGIVSSPSSSQERVMAMDEADVTAGNAAALKREEEMAASMGVRIDKWEGRARVKLGNLWMRRTRFNWKPLKGGRPDLCVEVYEITANGSIVLMRAVFDHGPADQQHRSEIEAIMASMTAGGDPAAR